MRLINANAFLDFLRIEEKIMEDEEITFDYVRSLIVSAPTIEAKPIVHAHWEIEYLNRYGHLCHCCSNCGFSASHKDKNWCANCGAQMDEGVKIPVISMEDVQKIAKEMEK